MRRKKRDLYIVYQKEKSRNKRRKIKIIGGVIIISIAVISGGILWHFSGLNTLVKKDSSSSEIQQIKSEGETANQTINNQNAKATDETNMGDINKEDVLPDSQDAFSNSQSPLASETDAKSDEVKSDEIKGDEIEDVMPATTDPNITAEPNTITEPESKMTEPVRGIYVSGARAGITSYMDELIGLTEDTEINTMVIDLKNDMGEITYKMNQPMVLEIGAGVNYVKDMKGLISKLKEKNIYLIARIVAFKDPLLAEKREDLSLKKKNGTVFKDKNGDSWVNPYKKEVWDYLVALGKEAAGLGFDEIQFDYIRFSTDSGMKDVDYGPEAKGRSKIDAITEFTKYACDNLKPLGVKVSADVYGTIIDSKVDAEIVGQDYTKMAEYLDYISPMIYPSHYGEGSFGIDYPDTKPYDTILAALKKSRGVLEKENTEAEDKDNKSADVRPWLQDFTATWVDHHINYGKEEIKAQIQAVYDAGYTEWILWNGSNNYTETAFEKN